MDLAGTLNGLAGWPMRGKKSFSSFGFSSCGSQFRIPPLLGLHSLCAWQAVAAELVLLPGVAKLAAVTYCPDAVCGTAGARDAL